jgi:hypothetical protein
MVERVARAIDPGAWADRASAPIGLRSLLAVARDRARRSARTAIIEAFQNPTEAMIEAYDNTSCDARCFEVLNALLRAALKDDANG